MAGIRTNAPEIYRWPIKAEVARNDTARKSDFGPKGFDPSGAIQSGPLGADLGSIGGALDFALTPAVLVRLVKQATNATSVHSHDG